MTDLHVICAKSPTQKGMAIALMDWGHNGTNIGLLPIIVWFKDKAL